MAEQQGLFDGRFRANLLVETVYYLDKGRHARRFSRNEPILIWPRAIFCLVNGVRSSVSPIGFAKAGSKSPLSQSGASMHSIPLSCCKVSAAFILQVNPPFMAVCARRLTLRFSRSCLSGAVSPRSDVRRLLSGRCIYCSIVQLFVPKRDASLLIQDFLQPAKRQEGRSK